MGLDMYLQADVYLSQTEWVNDEPVPSQKFQAVADALGLTHYETGLFGSGMSVSVPMGYWRKANQIHDWFVRNVQDGEDDCRSYYVNTNQLEELYALCKIVLKDKSRAEELLPTGAGFFFGSTEYDEYYFQDLENTCEIIKRCIESPYDSFEYHSSW